MESPGVCLIIEDDADIRGLVEVVLSGAGFETHTASTGADGIEAARRLDPALITLDIGLPDIDGHDVARRIREFTETPIIMLTARAKPTDELAGMASGAAAYLTKPFRPRQLRALALKLCGAKNGLSALP